MSRMTKPFMAAIAALLLAAPFSWAGGSSDSKTGGLSLQDAIERTGEKIAGELPKGSRVAIVAFETDSGELSAFIIEELTGALFDRGIEVTDRQNLEYVYKELNLQMSGDVSDESAKSIGKFLAADMVITGQLLDLDGTYRYRTSAINVETAVRASVTRLDVRSDNATRRMMAALASQRTTVKAAKYGVSEKSTPVKAAKYGANKKSTPVKAAKYGVSENSTPQTAGAFFDRGIMHASRGEYEMAIADFTEAKRLNPDLAPASYARRGTAYNNKGDYGRAIEDYTEAIRLDPYFAVAYYNRGVAYNNSGKAYNNKGDYNWAIANYNRAIADFTEAIRFDPNYASAYNNRGFAYQHKNDYDRAIADYTEAIRLNPNFAIAYKNRGYTYYIKKDYNRAIADYEAAWRIDPNDASAKSDLEKIRRARGW